MTQNLPLPLGEGRGEGVAAVDDGPGPHPNPLPRGEGTRPRVNCVKHDDPNCMALEKALFKARPA